MLEMFHSGSFSHSDWTATLYPSSQILLVDVDKQPDCKIIKVNCRGTGTGTGDFLDSEPGIESGLEYSPWYGDEGLESTNGYCSSLYRP
jgi:hypothetical protein